MIAQVIISQALKPDIGKTHRGLINAFGDYLIKNGPISKDLGSLLNRAEEIRLVADYRGDSVERSDAEEMVRQAEAFVAAVRMQCLPKEATHPKTGLDG